MITAKLENNAILGIIINKNVSLRDAIKIYNNAQFKTL